MIDPDQMQAIIIYIVSRLNCPQIMTEVLICEMFLPPAVRKSSRFIYLEMIQAACSFLIDQSFAESAPAEVVRNSWEESKLTLG
jgi:hypothetical protein